MQYNLYKLVINDQITDKGYDAASQYHRRKLAVEQQRGSKATITPRKQMRLQMYWVAASAIVVLILIALLLGAGISLRPRLSCKQTRFQCAIQNEGVPRIVFVCWFGGYQTESVMKGNRLSAYLSLLQNLGVPIMIVNDGNISDLVEVHPAFQYLAGVHKADYARCALLNKFGGGYHDIKHRSKSWATDWDADNWTSDDDVWMYCVRETREHHIGYPPGMKHIQKHYARLGSMCWIISKPGTPFLQELLAANHSELDAHIDQLRLHPGRNPGGYYSDTPFRPTVPKNGYPLRWLQILGELSHPLMLKYHKKIKFGLPPPDGGIPYK